MTSERVFQALGDIRRKQDSLKLYNGKEKYGRTYLTEGMASRVKPCQLEQTAITRPSAFGSLDRGRLALPHPLSPQSGNQPSIIKGNFPVAISKIFTEYFNTAQLQVERLLAQQLLNTSQFFRGIILPQGGEEHTPTGVACGTTISHWEVVISNILKAKCAAGSGNQPFCLEGVYIPPIPTLEQGQIFFFPS